MSDFRFLYELYVNTDEPILTQSVTGSKIGTVLEHIALTVSDQERTYGKGKVSVKMVNARLSEGVVLTDPKRMESLTTLVKIGVEHYIQKKGKLVVETTYPKKNSISENLRKILSNPKKVKKLVAELELPTLEKGDTLLIGKFKNRKAEIEDFTTDDNNQPIAKTTKGDQKIFKPRIAKLMPGAIAKSDEPTKEPVAENVQGASRKSKENYPEKFCKNPKCLWRVSSGPCPKHPKE